MGQQEVYSWLLKMRQSGCHEYFSTRQVQLGLVNDGLESGTSIVSVHCALRNLSRSGQVDMVRKSNWDRLVLFRLNDKCLKLSLDKINLSTQDTDVVSHTIIPKGEQTE